MNKDYLVKLVEDFCCKKGLEVSSIYEVMANMYQAEYGVNIDLEMRENGCCDMAEYLDSVGIVDRYVSILNRYKRELA